MVIRETFAVGPLGCNCSLLLDESTRNGVIIDPGGDPGRILERVAALKMNVRAILHTHAHIDHVHGTGTVTAEVSAPVFLHEGDLELYENLELQAQFIGVVPFEGDPPPVDGWLDEGDGFGIGQSDLEVLHTPGHTPGSVCFKMLGEHPIVFSGDTLFRRSVGRTDLWGGSFEDLECSIREKLFSLPADAVVVPGHGPETTIGEEQKDNPHVRFHISDDTDD